MYAVVRRYTNASALNDALVEKRDEVRELLTSVPGFVSYYGFRSGDSFTSVTVCEDETGTKESTNRAADWVRQNLSGASVSPPEVTEGDVFLQFGR